VFTVIFTQAARAELIDAQDWYEHEAAGLGRHFREAVDVLTERLNTNSQQFQWSSRTCAAPFYAGFHIRAVFRG
jgi:hypothetical protein